MLTTATSVDLSVVHATVCSSIKSWTRHFIQQASRLPQDTLSQCHTWRKHLSLVSVACHKHLIQSSVVLATNTSSIQVLSWTQTPHSFKSCAGHKHLIHSSVMPDTNTSFNQVLCWTQTPHSTKSCAGHKHLIHSCVMPDTNTSFNQVLCQLQAPQLAKSCVCHRQSASVVHATNISVYEVLLATDNSFNKALCPP